MLIDGLNEQLATGRDLVYPDGSSHFAVLRGFQARIAEAALYEFDRDAVAMCAHVSLGRPSSILASLSRLRLPAPAVWIEWSGADLRQAMADAGSPNVRPPGGDHVLERAGFLVWQGDDGFAFDYLSRNRDDRNQRIVDAAPVRGSFATKPSTGMKRACVDADEITDDRATGRLRDHLRMISRDPVQGAAHLDLASRHAYAPHPDFAAVVRAARAKGVDVADVVQHQSEEARRLFDLMVLPALVLLNCRNAVSVEREPAPERLNRSRAKAGKAPIRDRHVVRLSLTTRQAARARAAGDGGRSIRAALVVGHFKVRATGVFWWHPHARAGWGAPAQVVRRVMA